MKSLVSVIIPVYNADLFLKDCLDSIVCQTYHNLEIILINDGSDDNSLSICKDYALKDERIVVIDKENSGVGAARNDGLLRATGNYITFVDADDYLDKTYVEKMLIKANDSEAEVVFCGFNVVNSALVLNDTHVLKQFPVDLKKEILIRHIINTTTERLHGYIWRILFKRDKIKKLRFDLDVRIAEDFKFLLMTIQNVSNCSVVDEELYYYRWNQNSATAKYMPTLHEDMKKINEWMYESIVKYNKEYEMGYHCCVANTYLRTVQNICRKKVGNLFERIKYAQKLKRENGYQKDINIACQNDKLSMKYWLSFNAFKYGLDWLYILLFSIKCKSLF